MKNLTTFLLENQVEGITEEVVIGTRFKTEDGLLKFKIKPISSAEFSELQKRCTKIGKKGKTDFDSKRFNESLVINNTIEPNFRDANFIQNAKCLSAEEVLNKVLLAGEVIELSNQIQKISGFDQELDELRAEAKN